jgi:large subunit ribosomal protein L6
MKNIFKTNLKIPSNVKITLNGKILSLEGPKGRTFLNMSFITQQNLSFMQKKSLYSTFFRLFQKALVGVSLGFVVRLAFLGVGFRVESFVDNILKLKLGYSHFIYINIPFYIKIFSPKKTLLTLESFDEHLLKEFSSKICSFKIPDVYKGKGILYKNQILKLKEGKKK